MYRLIVAIYMYTIIVLSDANKIKIIDLNKFEANRENLQLIYPTHGYPNWNRSNLIASFPKVNSIKFDYEYPL